MKLVCLCACHLGLRPSKGDVKRFKREGIDGTDPIAVATACSLCAARHRECLDGMLMCRCGHEKFKHTTADGCAGTYAERCRCTEFTHSPQG